MKPATSIVWYRMWFVAAYGTRDLSVYSRTTADLCSATTNNSASLTSIFTTNETHSTIYLQYVFGATILRLSFTELHLIDDNKGVLHYP